MTSTHHMHTRSKSGIVKPRVFVASNDVPWKPKSFREANQYIEGRVAI